MSIAQKLLNCQASMPYFVKNCEVLMTYFKKQSNSPETPAQSPKRHLQDVLPR